MDDSTRDSLRAPCLAQCKMGEPLFTTLASEHNLRYMMTLMAELREKIRADLI